MARIRLIATDVDGTLLRSDRTISPRTLAALRAAEAEGVRVIMVSGRQVHGMRIVAQLAELRDLIVASNGAVGFDLASDRLIFEHSLGVAAQRHLVGAVTQALPGAAFLAVRDGGRTLVGSPRYRELMTFDDHFRTPDEVHETSVEELATQPSIKLIVRHARLNADEVFKLVSSLEIPGITATTSGAPFVEVSAASVSKAAGLAHICQHLGIDASEVAAFGDQRNDISMLAWAGLGVAMGNALPEVKAEATRVAASNDDDGLAIGIERLLETAVAGSPQPSPSTVRWPSLKPAVSLKTTAELTDLELAQRCATGKAKAQPPRPPGRP